MYEFGTIYDLPKKNRTFLSLRKILLLKGFYLNQLSETIKYDEVDLLNVRGKTNQTDSERTYPPSSEKVLHS